MQEDWLLRFNRMNRPARRSLFAARKIHWAIAVLGSSLRKAVRILVRLRMLWLLLLASLLLSGCVQYQVGLNFESQTRGEIVQRITLNERLAGFSGAASQAWIESLERRARKLQGKTKHLSQQDLLVTIPFSNGADLETKFNQFFHPSAKQVAKLTAATGTELPPIESRFQLQENNLLFLIRSHFSYDLDLRSLGLRSAEGDLVVVPGSLLDFEFSLHVPWKVRSIETASHALVPEHRQEGQTLIWTLQPGQLNHIEAVFWLPSPVGIGTALIVVLIVVGRYLRYQLLPRFGLFPAQNP